MLLPKSKSFQTSFRKATTWSLECLFLEAFLMFFCWENAQVNYGNVGKYTIPWVNGLRTSRFFKKKSSNLTSENMLVKIGWWRTHQEMFFGWVNWVPNPIHSYNKSLFKENMFEVFESNPRNPRSWWPPKACSSNGSCFLLTFDPWKRMNFVRVWKWVSRKLGSKQRSNGNGFVLDLPPHPKRVTTRMTLYF